MSSPTDQVSSILRSPGSAPPEQGALLDAVYDQLKRVAQWRMRGERSDHTLRATELVHEAFLRLSEVPDVEWSSKGHFFAAAAEAMRRILIEHARKRGTVKRGGSQRHMPIDVVDLAEHGTAADVLELEDAIATLASEDPRAAEVVRLRFYAGLSVEEVAESLDVSVRTAAREWSFARARLFQLLGEEPGVSP